MRDGWEAVKLAQCLASLDVRAGRNGPDLVLSVTEKRGIIPQSSVFKNRIATADTSKYKVLEKYDIAYNPYLLWCGAIGQWKGESAGVVSPVYECFRVNGNHDPSFFGLLFESGALTPYFNSTAIGSIERRRRTTPHVFMNAMLSVPPLVEQRRIVGVIQSVDNYIAALQEGVDAARIARNAVLHELLNAGGDGWVETALGEVARIGGGKRLPKGTPWSSTTTRHRYIRATDIHDGHVDEAQLVYVPDEVWPTIQRFTVQTSDVIITIAGTIGQLAIIEENLNGVNLTENAAFIRCVSESCIPDYILLLLSSYYGQSQIRALTVGTTQMKLGLERIASIKVVAPPLVEQQRIVEIVSSMDDSIRATEQTIVEAKNLRSGLLSDLLSGEHEIPESYDKLLGAA